MSWISIALISFVSIAGGVGCHAGMVGISRYRAAEKIRKNARKRYESAVMGIEEPFRSTLHLAEKYGQLQARVKTQTIARFLALLDRVEPRLSPEDRSILERFEGFFPDRFREYGTELVDPDYFAAGSLKALRAAHSIDRFAFGLIGFFGVAAFDRPNLLAWLSIKSVSADTSLSPETIALASVPLAPVLMFGGFFLRKKGERSLDRSREYERTIEEEIAKIATFETFCGQLSRQIVEWADLVRALNRKAIEGLNELESRVYASGATLLRSSDVFVGSVSFVADRDLPKLQEVSRLVRALAKIGGLPVLDGDGKLDRDALTLVKKYGDTWLENALEKG